MLLAGDHSHSTPVGKKAYTDLYRVAGRQPRFQSPTKALDGVGLQQTIPEPVRGLDPSTSGR